MLLEFEVVGAGLRIEAFLGLRKAQYGFSVE